MNQIPNVPTETVASRLLAHLAARGIEHVFANAGTDFAPIVAAFAEARRSGRKVPQPSAVPHEAIAVAIAHGHYLASGRPQAVMVHVNVGTANALANVMNAAKARVPLLVFAGRTPISDRGRPGHKNRNIHWAQESFDQGAIIREYVKWDVELRTDHDVETVIDRALQVAMSEPRGPVYVTLPREVIAESSPAPARRPSLPPATPPAPDAEALATLADLLGKAERPVLVTTAAGAEQGGFEAITRFAEALAVPVVQHVPLAANIATGHPMEFGLGPSPLVAEADVVLVAESDVPWIPGLEDVAGTVVHVGMDPVYADYPMRCFQAAMNLTASPAVTLAALADRVPGDPGAAERIAARRARLALLQSGRRAAALRAAADERPLSPAAINRAIARTCPDAVFVSEYNLMADLLPIARAGDFFGLSPAGSLGWGLGAAMGIRLARPDRLVVAGIGDGTHLFNNPSACHMTAAALGLPILVVVFNNARWNAVVRAHDFMYPRASAEMDAPLPLTELSPSPRFDLVAEASGGLGVRVERADELVPALERAVSAVMDEGRQALVDVRMG